MTEQATTTETNVAATETTIVPFSASRVNSTNNASQGNLRDRLRSQRNQIGKTSRITVDTFNFGIPTVKDTDVHIEECHGVDSWRYRTIKFLHQYWVQTFLMALLVLDVCILFTELFLLASYPSCNLVIRDGISCCPVSTADASTAEVIVQQKEEELYDTSNNSTTRLLSEEATNEDENEHHNFCEAGEADFSYNAGCDEHKWKSVHTAEHAFFIVTIIILCIFFIELNVSMIAMRPTVFFKQFFYLLDYFIITVSLILELTFHTLEDQLYESVAGLLVLIRLWRFVRIGHGFIELAHNVARNEYNELLVYTEELEYILAQNGITSIPSRPTTETERNHQKTMNEVAATDTATTSAHTPNDKNNILEKIEEEHRQKLREEKYGEYRPTGTPLAPETTATSTTTNQVLGS